jgi:toxin ParE1/3/4
MKEFRLSPQATLDLEEIWNFIGIERQNPNAASRQVEMIYDKFCILAENPLLGEIRKDLGRELRSFSAGNYAIIYRASTVKSKSRAWCMGPGTFPRSLIGSYKLKFRAHLHHPRQGGDEMLDAFDGGLVSISNHT